MGQDSSQLAGTSHGADGVIIKQDPEEKENKNLREVSNWEGSAVEERSLRSTGTKRPDGRKKKRKKRRSSSTYNATYGAAKEKVDKQTSEAGDSAINSQQTREAELTDIVGVTPSSVSRNSKQTELEAKKRRLLAVITAAAGNVDSPYSDTEFNRPAPSDSDGEEPELRSNGFVKPKKAKKSRNVEAASLMGNRAVKDRGSGRLTPEATQETKGDSVGKAVNKSKSKSSLASSFLLSNDEAVHLPTPHASIQIHSRQPLDNSFSGHVEASQKFRGKHKSHVSFGGTLSRLDKPKSTGDNPHTNEYPSDEDSEGEGLGSPNQYSDRVARNLHRNISPGAVNARILRETRILQPRSLSQTVATATSSQRQSSTKNMDLIDPALRGLGVESDQRTLQIGVYRDVVTPGSINKRKRRLPVDEDYLEQTPTNQPSMKNSRRQPLKPKTPSTSVRKSLNREFREESPDLDAPSNKIERRKSTSKGAKISQPTVKGRFSDEELEIIDNEMLKFREMKGMTVRDQNQIIQDSPSRLSELWDVIGDALPHRARSAIVKVCRRKYHNFDVRGKWTKEEDQQLKDAYEKFPNRWKQIGQVLNRHYEDVRDRWRNYAVCGDKMKKESWDESEENKLRAIVAECVQAVRELKASEMARNPGVNPDLRPDIELIDWQIVSAKLGHTRSRLQCLDKWNRMTKLENSDDGFNELELGTNSWRVKNAQKDIKDMRREDYIELLVALRNSHAGGEGKVNWTKLGDLDLRTKWTCMARKVAWKKLRASIPGNECMKFQDIVNVLLENIPENDAELEGIYVESKSPSGSLEEYNEPSPQKRALSDAVSSVDGDERHRDENIDPYLYELGENEFDPDDIENRHAPVDQYSYNSKLARSMIREAVDEAYDVSDVTDEENGNGNMAMADLESVDLDAPNQHKITRNSASRLRSPISFKAALNQDKGDDIDASTHSDEEDVDMDTAAPRISDASRNESVDLDME